MKGIVKETEKEKQKDTAESLLEMELKYAYICAQFFEICTVT